VAICNSQKPVFTVVSVLQLIAIEVEGFAVGFKTILSGNDEGEFTWADANPVRIK